MESPDLLVVELRCANCDSIKLHHIIGFDTETSQCSVFCKDCLHSKNTGLIFEKYERINTPASWKQNTYLITNVNKEQIKKIPDLDRLRCYDLDTYEQKGKHVKYMDKTLPTFENEYTATDDNNRYITHKNVRYYPGKGYHLGLFVYSFILRNINNCKVFR